MQQITINTKTINLNIFNPDDFYIEFVDEATQMTKIIECDEIRIKPKGKFIQVKWASLDLSPTGISLNRKELPTVTCVGEDYDFFVQAFGLAIKKHAINGAFKYLMDRFGYASYKIYEDDGILTSVIPAPFPEPET